MNSFGYYTGLVFSVYADGVSAPLGSGGRYDEAFSRLGERDLPLGRLRFIARGNRRKPSRTMPNRARCALRCRRGRCSLIRLRRLRRRGLTPNRCTMWGDTL